MAVLADILPNVGRSSRLALDLYKLAATVRDEAAEDLSRSAKAVNGFGSILKQLGTFIKEDDRIPSYEAIETLEDVIEQSRTVFSKLETIISKQPNQAHQNLRDVTSNGASRLDWAGMAKLGHLQAHLEALRATLAVMLQTMYTAQIIMWSKLEPKVSPQKVESVVASERCQLQTRVIEQQVAILGALKAHDQKLQGENRFLTEEDCSQSLILPRQEESPRPADLYWYQDKALANLNITNSIETQWLPSVCSIAASQSETLLNRWTSLLQFDDHIRDAERAAMKEKRDAQQPMVESDDEDDNEQRAKLAGNGARLSPHKSKSDFIQPLFMEPDTLPIPIRDTRYGPTAPLSPAASPRTSRHHVESAIMETESPSSPQSSIGSLPVEATAAVEAKEEDDDVDLEIPWTLCTRKYYWKYIDGKVIDSNTEHTASYAFSERNSWTEIMASWVCKEAIKEAGFRYKQVQKDIRDGRRTRLETCFCIERPLQFHHIKQLVERTVELYRQKKPATPPPQHIRRSSFQRPPPPPLNATQANATDRDKTPVPQKPSQPTLERSTTAMLIPSAPPRLDRSNSTPGPPSNAMPIPGYQQTQNPRTSSLQIPMPAPQFSTSLPQVPGPYSPSMIQAPYSPQLYNSPQGVFPQHPGFNQPPPIPPHMQPHIQRPHSPLRQSHTHSHGRSRYEDDYTTTDSDSGDRDRRRHRSKSRSRYAADKKKRSHNKSKAAGALLGVGGLTALLDGLSGL